MPAGGEGGWGLWRPWRPRDAAGRGRSPLGPRAAGPARRRRLPDGAGAAGDRPLRAEQRYRRGNGRPRCPAVVGPALPGPAFFRGAAGAVGAEGG